MATKTTLSPGQHTEAGTHLYGRRLACIRN